MLLKLDVHNVNLVIIHPVLELVNVAHLENTVSLSELLHVVLVVVVERPIIILLLVFCVHLVNSPMRVPVKTAPLLNIPPLMDHVNVILVVLVHKLSQVKLDVNYVLLVLLLLIMVFAKNVLLLHILLTLVQLYAPTVVVVRKL